MPARNRKAKPPPSAMHRQILESHAVSDRAARELARQQWRMVEGTRKPTAWAWQEFSRLRARLADFERKHGALLDLLALISGVVFSENSDERNNLAKQYADRMPRSVKGPAAQAALQAESRKRRSRPETLLREWLYPVGVLLAGTEAHVPQKVRLGREWVKTEDGDVALIRPIDLDLGEFVRWFVQRPLRITREYLEEVLIETDASDRDADTARPTTHAFQDERANALDALVAYERTLSAYTRLASLWKSATPRQRELLDCLEAGAEPSDLPELLNISPQAVATHLVRLRAKISKK